MTPKGEEYHGLIAPAVANLSQLLCFQLQFWVVQRYSKLVLWRVSVGMECIHIADVLSLVLSLGGQMCAAKNFLFHGIGLPVLSCV